MTDTDISNLGKNVIQGTGEVYYAPRGTRPPPGINLPPVGQIKCMFNTTKANRWDPAADSGNGAPATGGTATPLQGPNCEDILVQLSGSATSPKLSVFEGERWLDLDGSNGVLSYDGTDDVWSYKGVSSPPGGWTLSHKDQTLANNKIAILTASGWQSVGELAKAGISFGAVPQTQMIYQANEFYAFDAHDVAIADTFSVAILNASLEHFYNLVLHQNIAVFSSPDGSGKTTSKIRNLQFRPKGGPERHKHGWALLHDGFGTGYRETTEGGVFRRRLWLPRVVNAGSAPFQMSDDTQQAIVARFMVMQSNVVDKIKNIQLANSDDGSGGVGYLDNQQPPIEYWEDC